MDRGPMMVRIAKETWVDFMQVEALYTHNLDTAVCTQSRTYYVNEKCVDIVLRFAAAASQQRGIDPTPEMQAAVDVLTEGE